MPRGDKSSYTDRQKRKAEHIEEGYENRGVSHEEAERRAWATVNKQEGGGRKRAAKKTGSRKSASAAKKSSSARKRGAAKKSGSPRKRGAASKRRGARKTATKKSGSRTSTRKSTRRS